MCACLFSFVTPRSAFFSIQSAVLPEEANVFDSIKEFFLSLKVIFIGYKEIIRIRNMSPIISHLIVLGIS